MTKIERGYTGADGYARWLADSTAGAEMTTELMAARVEIENLRAEVERLRGALQDGVDDLASYADKKGAVKFAIEDVVFYMRTALAGKGDA